MNFAFQNWLNDSFAIIICNRQILNKYSAFPHLFAIITARMLKSYKFRIYPSKAQNHKLRQTLDLCCELYNAALQEKREAFKLAKISLNYHSQAIQLPEIKECRSEFGSVHSQVLQDTLKRLDKAFAAFFRR